MARTIYTTINESDIRGSRIVSMDFCPCKVFVIMRNDDEFIRQKAKEFNKPAIYVLLNKDTRQAYIGETDNFQARLQSHRAQKKFWTEAYAFTAVDGSLTQTEVMYLESVAYSTAANANNYDLTENGQIPQGPYIMDIQRYKADEFFRYVLLLSDFIGCDVFLPKITRRVETQLAQGPLKRVVTKAEPDPKLAGRVQLTLNGKGPFKKNRFVHAVVKEYLELHPETTFEDLRSVFPRELLAQWARWDIIESDIETARLWKERGDVKARYLLKDEDILTSSDGIRFIVCTEWDKNNLPNIITIVKSEGWSYSIISK